MSHYSVIVIGAGAGGLVIAIGAARAGKKVLLIEKGNWGGDCTNFGCIPSKSLIASAHAAHALKEAKELGIRLFSTDFQAHDALSRVRSIVEKVRSKEDPTALHQLGIETLEGTAQFVNARTLEVNGAEVSGDHIVIATGSSAFIPPLAGLHGTPYLTNETIFDLKEIPKSLCVIGGGPIGCELAQAFHRLGSKVTLIHSHDTLLGKEEKDAQEIITKTFAREGIELKLGNRPGSVNFFNDMFEIDTLQAEKLLVAVGRRPNVEKLNLEAAGIHYTEKGIPVDAYGRTNRWHVWAVGDVTGGPLFTHAAENEARAVLYSLLAPWKKKMSCIIPRTTFTDPEVASVGLLESEADSSMAVYTVPFEDVDRAITAGRTEGFVKIVTKKWSSQILGATIVAPRAGEMLAQICTAMVAKIPLRKLANVVLPYPTYNLAIRKAADMWLSKTILPLFRHEKKY